MAADRAQHVAEVVVPALDAGTWVVTDRFSASTLAYQGCGRGLDRDRAGRLIQWATGGLDPDLTVLIDVPVALAVAPAERQRRRPPRGRGRRLPATGGRRVPVAWPPRRRRPGWWSTAPGRRSRWRPRSGRASATPSAPDAGVAVAGMGESRRGHRRPSIPRRCPCPALFDEVVGQPRAVAQLTAAARQPVHAYLLHGPPGSGKRAAARGLAAALLCPRGGCGDCNTCRRALAGTHPDLVVVERSGAVTRRRRGPGHRDPGPTPTRSSRPARCSWSPTCTWPCKAAPALLKTVEEPPPATVFVLLADDLPPTLATIVSRCVQVPFDPVPDAAVVDLAGRPAGSSVATPSRWPGRREAASTGPGCWSATPGSRPARSSGGRCPSRLDGTGAAAAAECRPSCWPRRTRRSAPLREQHAQELATLAEQAELMGAKGIPGARQIEDRHKREERRWRTDDLRFGLGHPGRDVPRPAGGGDRVRARRPAPPGGASESQRAVRQIEAIDRASAALGRNVNESLLMDALMVELSGMTE